MLSARCGSMSIRLVSRSMSTIRRTTPFASCSSLRQVQAARSRSVTDSDAPVGSLRNVYLVVTDLEAARSRLLERGVHVGEIPHKTPIGAWDGGFALGLDPARGDYASSANFSDPDGPTAGCYRNGATAMSEVLLMVGRCRILDLIEICSGSRYKNGTSS